MSVSRVQEAIFNVIYIILNVAHPGLVLQYRNLNIGQEGTYLKI